MRIVILGLSITSSWGNGHATTYRGLVRALAERGHEVLFLERDKPWYADNRDMPRPPFCRTILYSSLAELEARHAAEIRNADLTIVGSFVPDGVAVARFVVETARRATAFYDIDTPVTLGKLAAGDYEYLSPELIPLFDLYFSFTGGPTLQLLERKYGAQRARALYCSVDPTLYTPGRRARSWDLGYLGTYSDDRQPKVDALLIAPASAWPEGRFIVAGPQYPQKLRWPANVQREEHLAPDRHRGFYNAQRFTLNITRAAMVEAGWSPSVRLFEAAACGTAIISDWWNGLDTILTPDTEILIASGPDDVLRFLRDLPDRKRRAIAAAGRERVLAAHTPSHRAAEVERAVREVLGKPARRGSAPAVAPAAGA